MIFLLLAIASPCKNGMNGILSQLELLGTKGRTANGGNKGDGE